MSGEKPAGQKKSEIESNEPAKGSVKVYTLEVFLVGGWVTEEFEDKEISRTIQIKGSQTLEDLHDIIFEAFDRWDEHLYEFNLGEGPQDRSALYSLPASAMGITVDEEEGDVTRTTIESLGLAVDRAFGYWFDFGDDWHHQINVVAIDKHTGSGKYPKITKRVGESPPQYLEPDEDEDEE